MSAPCIHMQDPITLVLTDPSDDGFASEVVSDQADVMAAVDFNTGYAHGGHSDTVNSDATIFVNPMDDFVKANFNRLEEMLVLIDLFNTPENRAWYKVVRVQVARDTQLCNEIDHLELLVKKTAPLAEDIS